jgi:hypothetical protein
VCIADAHSAMQKAIFEANRNYFNKNGYTISYHSKCSTSWLQIETVQGNNFDQPIAVGESKIIIVNNQK